MRLCILYHFDPHNMFITLINGPYPVIISIFNKEIILNMKKTTPYKRYDTHGTAYAKNDIVSSVSFLTHITCLFHFLMGPFLAS